MYKTKRFQLKINIIENDGDDDLYLKTFGFIHIMLYIIFFILYVKSYYY